MRSSSAFAAGGLCALILGGAFCPAQDEKSAPIYSVTVVSHNLVAINYQHRTGPTKIDFKGTVLLPYGHGVAVVETKKGRFEIDCKFEHLESPQRFALEYLTYVLWAITPEGRAASLGEVVPDASDKAEIRVTTDLPVFGLIVSAEPYFSVSRPSDVVVLENEVRRDTVGTVEQVHAKYELLPREKYTYQVPSPNSASEANAPKVSMDEYEALLELYQAQNAVQIARSAGADQFAPDTYMKAVQLLEQAQEFQKQKKGARSVVTAARAATEIAEDAREVATKRHDEENASGGGK